MQLFSYIIIYSLISGVLSLFGAIVLLGNERLLRKFSIHLISFAAGTLLGTAFFDLLPEGIRISSPNIDSIFVSVVIGIVSFFIIEQIICRIHAHPVEADEGNHAIPDLVNLGDAIHNFIDGIAIAGAFLINIQLGIITSVAVAVHEVPQEISDSAILYHHGWNRKKIIITNLLISFTSVLGAMLTYLLKNSLEQFLPVIIGFTAGNFIYIATTSLLPQLTSKKHDKPSHVILLLIIGIISVWILSNKLNG